MRQNKNGMVILFLSVICFTLFVVSTAQAYSYDDYHDGDEDYYGGDDINRYDEDEYSEEDNDNIEYYDYHTGQMKTIPDPDPYYYPMSYGYSRSHRSLSPVSPISVMMPLFIFFFVFLPWLAYALGEEG